MSDYGENDEDFLGNEEDDVEVVEDEEHELFFSVEGLGQLHRLDDGTKVFVISEDTTHCVHDIQTALRNENAGGSGDSRKVDKYLGQWQTVSKQLVPLFLHHRDDNRIWTGVLKLLVIMTRPLNKSTPDIRLHLKYLQDYKEAMNTRDMFIVLMSIMSEAITTNTTVETQINEIETQIEQIDIQVPAPPSEEPPPASAAPSESNETQAMEHPSSAETPVDETLLQIRKEEEERRVRKDRKRLKEQKKAEIRSLTEKTKVHEKNVELVLTLVRHLLEIPDPRPGEPGYTQARASMQIQLIKYLSDEAVLDALIMFGEQVEFPKYHHLNWLFLEIFYHVCAAIPPTELANFDEQLKVDLTKLLDIEKQLVYAQVPKYARHSRFAPDSVLKRVHPSCGTLNENVSAITQKAARAKFYRERRIQQAAPDGQPAQAPSLFQDPAFIDIVTGLLPVSILGSEFRDFYAEIKSFIDRFLEVVFASLMKSVYVEIENEKDLHDYDLVRVINMITWILDYQYKLLKKALMKASKNSKRAASEGGSAATPAPTVSPEPLPSIDNIQWAIGQDALSLVAKQVKLHSKEAKTIKAGGANLVVALRALLEQVKMAKILGPESGDAFRILDSLCYDDVPRALTWTIRNFKPTVHRPEVLWYSLECVEELAKCIDKYVAKKATNSAPRKSKKNKSRISKEEAELQGIEFYEQNSASDSDVSIRSSQSNEDDDYDGTEESLIESKAGIMADLCHGESIGNLFYVLQNFKDNPTSANDSVCAAIMRITMQNAGYVAYFFQLSYLIILHNIINDPLLRAVEDERRKYASVILITKLIIRKFIQCARVNKNVFVEILFPRTKVGRYGSLLSIETDLSSICNNYKDEETRIILERIHQGDTYENLKAEKREQAVYGTAWTDDEDQQLLGLWDQVNSMEGKSRKEKVNTIIANTVPMEGRKKRRPKEVYHRLLKLGLIENMDDADDYEDDYSDYQNSGSDGDYRHGTRDTGDQQNSSPGSDTSEDEGTTNPRSFQDYVSRVNRVKVSDLMVSVFGSILGRKEVGLTTEEQELIGRDLLVKVLGA